MTAWAVAIGITRAIRPADYEGNHIGDEGFGLCSHSPFGSAGPRGFAYQDSWKQIAPSRNNDRTIHGRDPPARLYLSSFSEELEIKSTSCPAASTRARIKLYDGPSFEITRAVAALSGGPQMVFHFRLCLRKRPSKSKSCCEVPVRIQLSRPLQRGYIALQKTRLGCRCC